MACLFTNSPIDGLLPAAGLFPKSPRRGAPPHQRPAVARAGRHQTCLHATLSLSRWSKRPHRPRSRGGATGFSSCVRPANRQTRAQIGESISNPEWGAEHVILSNGYSSFALFAPPPRGASLRASLAVRYV